MTSPTPGAEEALSVIAALIDQECEQRSGEPEYEQLPHKAAEALNVVRDALLPTPARLPVGVNDAVVRAAGIAYHSTEGGPGRKMRAALETAYAIDARPVKARQLDWEGSWAASPYGKFELDFVGDRWTCITPFDAPDMPYYARTPHETKEAAMAEAQRRFEAKVKEQLDQLAASIGERG